MLNQLSRFHQFLARQSLYPILLSTALALAIYAVRVLISHSLKVYSNLVWNLVLAWVPYLASLWAIATQRSFPRYRWLLLVPGLLWLVFFPNAPYIITDFLHLEKRPAIPLWYDILLLVTFAWTGIFLAIASLRNMQELVTHYFGRLLSWLFVGFALGLSGLGIYLGRFERWNSWDVLLEPRKILGDITQPLENPTGNLSFFGFTLLITAFLLVVYLMFISIQRRDLFKED